MNDDKPKIDMTGEEVDNQKPVYPEGILPRNEKYDYPQYKGDTEDLTERRNTKLFNIWCHYTDLRKNEKLFDILNSPEETKHILEEVKFLKLIMVLTIDRIGKILSDTNIVEEITKKSD